MGKRPTHETWVKWLLKKVLLWASIGTGVLIVWSLASQWLRSMEAAERSSALRDYFTGQTDMTGLEQANAFAMLLAQIELAVWILLISMFIAKMGFIAREGVKKYREIRRKV